MKLSRIGRVVRLLTALQSGHKYKTDELAELVGISRRTLFRDLKELEEIGVPYLFDPKSFTYSIEPEFFLPSIDLNLQEALSLLMLVHKSCQCLPMPFKNSALLGGLKIENNMPVKIRQYCNATLENISVKPDSHAPMDQLDQIFSQLQGAVRKKRIVRAIYQSIFERKDIEFTLSPYHLIFNKRAWYVVGWSSLHKEFRTFKLNRIKKLDVLDKCFIINKKFDIHEHFGRAWSMIPEGRIYHIKLRFAAKVAKNVSEVQWHSTQTMIHNNDGSLTVEFRVDGLDEISWWILGYGDQVEVLQPSALRKRIASTAGKTAELNK